MSTITNDTESTTPWHDPNALDDDAREKIVDLVLDRIHDGETTREVLHDWEIAHPDVIDGILLDFLRAGLLMEANGNLSHTRLVEYI